MISKEAIQELSRAAAIEAATKAIGSARSDIGTDGLIALPNDYTVHDIERHMPTRRRQRGSMTTPIVADFAGYVAAQSGDGAAVFVDPVGMKAVAVLNLGTPAEPGHADHTATYAPQMTAAYAALLKVHGNGLSQSALAEWMEDWSACLAFWKAGGDSLDPARAVAAVRAITIEGLRRVQTSEQQLSASRSAFEEVKAKATNEADALPTRIEFACQPYSGMAARTLSLRLSITTTGDKPALTVRIAKHEQHIEQMAAEVCELVRGAIGSIAPVMVGAYRAV